MLEQLLALRLWVKGLDVCEAYRAAAASAKAAGDASTGWLLVPILSQLWEVQ